MKNEETKKQVNKKGNGTSKSKTTKNTNAKNSAAKKTNGAKKANVNNDVKKSSGKTSEVKKVAKKEEVKEIENTSKEEVMEEVVEAKKEIKTTNVKKKNNKSDIFLIIGLVVVAVIGFFMLNTGKEEVNYELPLALTGEAGMHQLTYAEYQEKIDNNEAFVVILERATCSHCVTFMPVATKFAEDNGLPMYYVDTDTFSEEDWAGFEKSNSYLKKSKGQWGTPTTVVLAGNQAVDYVEGETTAENLLDLYNKYFEIEE